MSREPKKKRFRYTERPMNYNLHALNNLWKELVRGSNEGACVSVVAARMK